MINKTLVSVKVFFCATFLFFACSDKEIFVQDLPQDEPAIPEDSISVSAKQAIEVANAFFNKQEGFSALKNSMSKQNASVEAIKDENNPLMYVVNFPEGGWAIISATRDYYPVLAYSEENSFLLAPDMGPVAFWMDMIKDDIKASKNFDDQEKSEINILWKSYETGTFQISLESTLKSSDPAYDAYITRKSQLITQYYPGWTYIVSLVDAQNYLNQDDWQDLLNVAYNKNSPPEYTLVVLKLTDLSQQVGPLLATNWHQGSPFNNLTGCTSAGCVTIAMAQIMKFHEHPSIFNWSDIPISGISLYQNTELLILNIGYALGLNFVNCNVGVNNNKIKSAFQSFGYSTTIKNHNHNDVYNEIINYQRPISMGGYPNSILGIPCGEGHQWVCDGVIHFYRLTTYFVEYQKSNYTYTTYNLTSPSKPDTSSTETLFFHMNWGWSPSYNAWFAYGSANSGNGNFQYGRTNAYVHP